MAKILVVGAGSIGVYLGTLLFAKGNEVTLLGRDEMKKLHDTILIGEVVYKLPPRVYELINDLSFDYVFVTSKLYDLKDNLQLILNKKVNYKGLISIQNGLVDESLYKPYVRDKDFTSISVFEGYRLVENQLIASHSKTGWKTDDSSLGKKICNLLKEAGINCGVDSNLDVVKAEKTIMNCSVNLLSAIEKKTFFELCRDKTLRKRIDLLFDESYEVLKNKVKLGDKEVLRKKFYETVGDMKHYSSTYQDAISKRRTEVSFLNEYIVVLGKKYGVKTPENKRIVEEFKKIFS